MIYFDNAATGGFKPNSVIESSTNCIKYLLANPGRSGHRLSLAGAEIVYNCRKVLAELFNAEPDRVIFTKNCTEALNLAIFGSLKVGGHVITTVFEHNSVLRPLTYLKNKGLITLDILSPDCSCDIYSKIENTINENTYLVVCTATSNVTGENFDISRIGKICKEKDILFLSDGAQGAGHREIDLKKQNVSMLAIAGHKGLYSIMGIGALILNYDVNLTPLIFGGTGTESFNLNQPLELPERLESGTLNLPAIASLLEGAKYVKQNGNIFSKTLNVYTDEIINALREIDEINCYSKPNGAGIISFELKNMPSSEVADILNSQFDIAVRGGLHCAPLTHRYLGTDNSGLVRASVAVQNSSREMHFFIRAIKEIARLKSF